MTREDRKKVEEAVELLTQCRDRLIDVRVPLATELAEMTSLRDRLLATALRA